MIELAISVENISKTYRIWRNPTARLKAFAWETLQFIIPRNFSINSLCKKIGWEDPSTFYKDFHALKDISFHVKEGEIVGIIGCNGSGKSTLLQIIAGTLQPTTGKVSTKGLVAALLELGSGFNTDFTGRENIYMNAAILGLSVDELEQKLDEILSFADLGDFVDQPVRVYSSGMVMRLAFSTQVAVNPKILIVDEALAVGDESFQNKCFRRIEQLKEEGATILLVSHAPDLVINLCDRAIMLRNGSIFVNGRPKSVITIYQKSLSDRHADDARLKDDFKRLEATYHKAPASGITCLSSNADTYPVGTDKSFFDPNLQKPQVTEYTDQGAKISDCEIINSEGHRVNNLLHGGTYTFRFLANFEQHAFEAAFGCMVKSLSGQELCGTNSRMTCDEEIHPSSEEEYEVRFAFQCHLLSGLYTINAGITELRNGIDEFMVRRVDSVLFRVADGPNIKSHGQVGLFQKVEVERRRTAKI